MTTRFASSVLAASLAIVSFSGCGDRPIVEPPESIILDQIPADIMAKAKAQLPGVEFERAWVDDEHGTRAYEIRGRDEEGKIREVKISASGEVLETE